MIPYYLINNNICKAGGINNNLDWFIMYYFHKLVNDDQDQFLALTFLISQNW